MASNFGPLYLTCLDRGWRGVCSSICMREPAYWTKATFAFVAPPTFEMGGPMVRQAPISARPLAPGSDSFFTIEPCISHLELLRKAGQKSFQEISALCAQLAARGRYHLSCPLELNQGKFTSKTDSMATASLPCAERCLITSHTIGPSGPVLSTLTGSVSLWGATSSFDEEGL